MPEIYTHGHHESVLRSHRRRTAANSAAYALDRLTPGADVLDVGCGPGTITVDLARRVAPGRVVGIDRAPDVLEAARRDAAGAAGVEFVEGDVYALPVEDAGFDVVHAHQVLQHLADPVAALREMRRACRPGGVVAARDSVYAAMSWHPADPLLDRWLDLYRRAAIANGGDPDAGRRLLSWALAAGFSEVVPSASAWCFATPDERDWWGGMWADRIVASALATQMRETGLATDAELGAISAAWRRWAAAPDAWFGILHGEVVCAP
ncbi:MAG TPA: methyltransferase domain-containing protein [Candidatus Dormibacteraeota bacterium]|nr:methyltransferase domain-containing protein [Candidatus Dormibacteraeota bacterium]